MAWTVPADLTWIKSLPQCQIKLSRTRIAVRSESMDFLYILLEIAFIAASIALVHGCEKLRGPRS